MEHLKEIFSGDIGHAILLALSIIAAFCVATGGVTLFRHLFDPDWAQPKMRVIGIGLILVGIGLLLAVCFVCKP